MSIEPDVSIIIRTKNEGKSIGSCLQSAYEQDSRHRFEIIVIDSGSTDDTLEICRNYPVVIHEITPFEFNFGRALNLGVELARGKYVIALTAHALPANDRWLEPLVSTLENDHTIAGAYSRQLPRPGCNPFEAIALQATFGDAPHVLAHAPLKARDIVFSNASSCLAKQIIAGMPFRELPYAEDREWAQRVISRGYKIAYAPESVIYHSHNRTLWARYQIVKRSGRAFFDIDGDRADLKVVLKYLLLPKVLGMYRRYCVTLRRMGHEGTYLRKWAALCVAYSFAGHCGEFVGSRFGAHT